MRQPDKQESGGEQIRRRRIVIAVFVAAIVALALWLGSGSGMSDEGSYEWCAQQGLDRAGCDVVNELADEVGGSPSDVLHLLNNSLAPLD